MYPDQQNPYGQQPQQGTNGQYQVVPPPLPGQNNGHSGHNPYEFIVNPNMPKSRRNLFGGNGLSFGKRIGIIVGGVVVLLIIASIIISALAPKGSTPGLIAIAQRQQEIIRVATAADQQATSQEAKNFVATTVLSITSSQQQVLGYLASHGTKLKGKVLALDQNAQTDTLLNDAASAGNYDSAVAQNLADQLQTYQGLLQTTYKQTNNSQAKQLLQGCFGSADTLVKQAKALTTPS